MSREIKFRVYDKDLCKYVREPKDGDTYEETEFATFNNLTRLEFAGEKVKLENLCLGRYSFEMATGVKDNTGREIYVEDLVQWGRYGEVYRVVGPEWGAYGLIHDEDRFRSFSEIADDAELRLLRIVGSIHDEGGSDN